MILHLIFLSLYSLLGMPDSSQPFPPLAGRVYEYQERYRKAYLSFDSDSTGIFTISFLCNDIPENARVVSTRFKYTIRGIKKTEFINGKPDPYIALESLDSNQIGQIPPYYWEHPFLPSCNCDFLNEGYTISRNHCGIISCLSKHLNATYLYQIDETKLRFVSYPVPENIGGARYLILSHNGDFEDFPMNRLYNPHPDPIQAKISPRDRKQQNELESLPKSPSDTTAIILLDSVNYTLSHDRKHQLWANRTRYVRLWIGNEKALSLATILLYNDGNSHRIDRLHGRSYPRYRKRLANKQKVKHFSTDLGYLKVPGARIGSIIEYQYREHFLVQNNLPEWSFQWNFPVRRSSCRINKPLNELLWDVQHIDSADLCIQHNNKHTVFTLQNSEPYTDYEWISTRRNHDKRLRFRPSPRPNTNDSCYYSKQLSCQIPYILSQIASNQTVTEIDSLPRIPALQGLESLSPRCRYDSIIKYFRGITFFWPNEWEFIGKPNDFLDNNPSVKLNSNYLKCKQLGFDRMSVANKMAATYLRSAGYQTDLCLLRRAIEGRLDTSLFAPNPFNYMAFMTMIDSIWIMGDLTPRFNPELRSFWKSGESLDYTKVSYLDTDLWPQGNLNTPFIQILGPNHYVWHNPMPVRPSKKRLDLEQKFTSPGIWKGHLKAELTDYEASLLRQYARGNLTLLCTWISSPYFDIDESSIRIENYNSPNLPYLYQFDLTSPSNPLLFSHEKPFQQQTYLNQKLSQSPTDSLYVKPFFNLVGDANIFQETIRHAEVNLHYPSEYTYTSTILLPKGYQFDPIPPSVDIDTDAFELHYRVENREQTRVFVSLFYRFKHVVYPATAHPDLKANYQKMLDLARQPIVLRKTNPER